MRHRRVTAARADRAAVDELAREPQRHRAMRVLIAQQLHDRLGFLRGVDEITGARIIAPPAADGAKRDLRWNLRAQAFELFARLRRQWPAAADESRHTMLQRRADVLGLAGFD